MGLQSWPPSSTAPLSSMACLDVETPSICRGTFKSVLQLCLQQRRTREQLVEQGIMPPLKMPVAFHEQIRSLERARTGNYLKHKLCSRPERSELVRMHILQETQAQPSLQATQMRLKRARLADDLNEKIAQRPGPMELVEKNILPVDSGGEDADAADDPTDVYNFDEDSSDALSPQRPASQQSPSSTSASPRERGHAKCTSASSNLNPLKQLSLPLSSRANLGSTGEQQINQKVSAPQPVTTVSSVTPGPVLVKQSLPKPPGDKSRSKRSKESKPRVKKLKYHQYIPPDQKQELNEGLMDSAYGRLLQQQQQFLQLQILSQQQQFNYQATPSATLMPTTEVQTSCSSVPLSGKTLSIPAQPRDTQTNRKPDHLPANLDEMKVAELKMELKLRSLPVSGTKTDLIERLKLYQENSRSQNGASIRTKATTAAENKMLTPPVSPIASKVSALGLEDSCAADSPNRLSDSLSPARDSSCVNSPQRAPQEDSPPDNRPCPRDFEKDKRLHEKERQIAELMRKLEREQRLVEVLKMQLEVEKRSPPQRSPLIPVRVKEENMSPTHCSASCTSPALPLLVKQEEAVHLSHFTPQNHFVVNHQSVAKPDSLQPVQAAAQIVLPASLSVSAVGFQPTTVNGIRLHTTVSSAAAAPGLIHNSGQVPQKIEASAALQEQSSTQSQLLTKSPASQPSLILPQPKFTNLLSKCKDPPRYEDAVKQTRSMLTAVQGPTAASQQMDDLFDVLIESGEISPFIRQVPLHLDKPLPVTASVTTLPVNTVLSRPPPMVQVAQIPASQLDRATPVDTRAEPQTLKPTEELHSPMEVDFHQNTPPPPALNLHGANMDTMDWLELPLSVPAGSDNNPLDMSAPSLGVFSADFLDSHELALNWE